MSSNGGLDLDDIQGIILRGFRSFPWVRHFLFHIDPANIAGARELCGLLVPGSGAPMTVTPATRWPKGGKPPYCLNFAVARTGLSKLITAANYQAVKRPSGAVFASFDAGAESDAVSQYVGDTGTSAPANWWKNGHWQLPDVAPSTALLDILITLYTPTKQSRDDFTDALLGMIPGASTGKPAIVRAFVEDCDPLDPPGSIHFGYVDGISQPRVAGFDDGKARAAPDDRPEVPSYFFVLNGANPKAPYNNHPFLNDGCFGAFRLLHQDVGAFEAFIAESGSDSELVAAKMAGRWRDGTPLEVSPDKPDPSIKGNTLVNFNYLSASPNQQNAAPAPNYDSDGSRCPYASHIRRTNPRDDVAVKGNNPVGQSHRVMRRAFPYGPPYASDPNADRGLAGVFMGASIREQFEFVQQSWISGVSFRDPDASKNKSGIDPLFGPQPGQDTNFDYLSASGSYSTVANLKRFIRTDGGLYVLLPSVQALALMAKGAIA